MEIAQILQQACERWPTRVAVVDGDLRLTYAELGRRAATLATRLAELGIERGERVALSERNSGPFLECTFAAARLGAILVPINTRLAAPEQVAVLQDAEAVAWIANTAFEPTVVRVASELGELKRLIWIGAPSNPGLGIPADDYEQLATGSREGFAALEFGGSAVAQLYYTSGTTGRPKGVMLTHANVCSHAAAATSELDLDGDDVWGHFAPMFHLADAWATTAITWVGGRHVVSPRFDARTALELMHREGVTITNLIPTMIQRLLLEASESETKPDRLRLLLSGGAPIAKEVVQRILDTFGCEYVQTYGMTETSPYLTLSQLKPHHWQRSEEERLRVRARTGRPFETIELEIVDERGQPVPADDTSVGEIRVRGGTVSPGYWRNSEATAEAFRGGWLYTGDLAVIDEEGYVNIVDRRKDMILSGGENVYSTEVENALYAHPAVLEAAVFGVPDAQWGEAVRAAVVLRPDAAATAEQLRETCRERLAAYKVPQEIDFHAELPKTGSGKIKKAALREMAAAAR